jgi:hypothetical protein
MEGALYSSGVCSTSYYRASTTCRAVGKSTDFCRQSKLCGPQTAQWKSSRGYSLFTCSSRALSSRDILLNTKSLRGLWKKSFRASENSNNRNVVCATLTKDESTETEKEIKHGTENGSQTKTENGSLSETEEKPEIEDTLPEQAVLSQHPWDPHPPNYSKLIPEAVRPYPSFEGCFVRLWDPESNFSAAVILATNYVTEESQVSLLFTPCKEDLGSTNKGAIRSEEDGKYVLRTYAVAEMSKVSVTFVFSRADL